MSTGLPVIKFSPFEALLIGEKNKILKRQPMKNTVFLSKINHERKKFNLRDLFDLDKNKTLSKNNDAVFKMPQRVFEFLKNRKFRNITKKSKNCNELQNNSFLDSNNLKRTKKKDDVIKSRGRKPKLKPNNVKFKSKFNSKKNLDRKMIRNLKSYTKKRKIKQKILSKLLKKDLKIKKDLNNRHQLRGKDGKFISRKEYESLKSTKLIAKQNYLSNYLHQLYLKRNRLLCENNEKSDVEKEANCFQEIHSSFEDAMQMMPKMQNKKFDVEASESILNEVSKMYYSLHCQQDIHFPKIDLDQLTKEDFENSSYLLDILFENFPKKLKFKSDMNDDECFSVALREANIIKNQTTLKMYEKRKNGFTNSEKLTVIFNNHLPYIKFSKVDNVNMKSLTQPFKNGLNKYSPTIDEPHTNKNHLITAKSFGSFFFKSAEGQEIFIGSILKPFIHNSWFGSLPEF